MLDKRIDGKRFGCHVGRLIVCADFQKLEGIVFPCGELDKVEKLDIYVLGPRSHLWELGNGKCTTGVFEQLAMHNGLVGLDVKSTFLHLVQNVDDGDCHSQSL